MKNCTTYERHVSKRFRCDSQITFLLITNFDALLQCIYLFHLSTCFEQHSVHHQEIDCVNTRVGTLIVATIYLQLIQNRYMFRRFTVLQCGHQHCVQPVASDVEVVGYLQQRLLC